MNTQDLIVGDRLMCLFKGDPKTGKSGALGSFPDLYVFDIDGRIRSLLKMHPKRAIEFDTYTDFWKVIEKLQALKKRCDYGTVAISSLTSLANLAIEYSIEHRGGGDGKDLKRGDLRLTDVSDWGVEFRGLSQILDLLKCLPCHVILEAHVLEVTRENIISKSKTVSRSLMTGGKKIAAYLPTAFDEAYHFFVDVPMESDKMPRFKAATMHMGEDWAGSVLPLPPVIDWTKEFKNSPTFYEILQGYLKNPHVDAKANLEMGVIP